MTTAILNYTNRTDLSEENSFYEMTELNKFSEDFDYSTFDYKLKNSVIANIYDVYRSKMFANLIQTFEITLESKINLSEEIKNEIQSKFEETVNSLYQLPISKLTAHITNEESIYFRINSLSDLDIHIETFYINSSDEENIESVCNVYRNNFSISKNYGSMKNVFQNIKDLMYNTLSFNYTSAFRENGDSISY